MSDLHAEAHNKASNRRRRFIVNSSFQWKYSLSIAIAVLVVSTLLSSIQFGMLHQQARLRAASPESYFANITTTMYLFSAGFAALTAMGICAWSIIVTHRICGPLFILERYFRELGENRIPKVRPLRKKDELKELFATFTTSMLKLREQRLREKQAIEATMEKLEILITNCDEQRRPGLEQAKGELDQLCRDITTSLGENCMNAAVETNAKIDV